MKKDFQKVVKMFRETLPAVTQHYSTGEVRKVSAPEYPKAMMTAQQMRKGTATVNFSTGKRAKENAEAFMNYIPFVAWCETYGIKRIEIETAKNAYGSADQYQIRVTY
jgi:hypothetical protein